MRLIEIDAAVAGWYGLSDEQERELVGFLHGSRRALTGRLAWTGYSPHEPDDGITFSEVLAVTRDWETVNQRRCGLIERRLRNRLSPVEAEELASLQELADKRIQMFAPLPIADLDRILESMSG